LAPAMADGGALDHVVLVDLDPQPRPGRDGHHAVPIVEDGAVHHVVEQVVVGVVMDAQALLLDEGVVGPGVDLQAGGQGDLSQREYRRSPRAIGVGVARRVSSIESRFSLSTGSSMNIRWKGSSSRISTLAIGACTRPWKSTATPMSSPTASRMVATFSTARVT